MLKTMIKSVSLPVMVLSAVFAMGQQYRGKVYVDLNQNGRQDLAENPL